MALYSVIPDRTSGIGQQVEADSFRQAVALFAGINGIELSLDEWVRGEPFEGIMTATSPFGDVFCVEEM